MEKETSLSEKIKERTIHDDEGYDIDDIEYIETFHIKEAVKQDYKNVVLAKRGEISWQEYARNREKIFGDKLT